MGVIYEKEVVFVTATTVMPDNQVSEQTRAQVRPTREQVLDAIVNQTGCTRSLAGRTINWIDSFVRCARANSYATQFPTTQQLRSQEYRVFDAIVGHGQTSTEGSAHDLIERHLLDPARDEFSLFHDMRDEVGSPNYCQVQVCTGVMRTS